MMPLRRDAVDVRQPDRRGARYLGELETTSSRRRPATSGSRARARRRSRSRSRIRPVGLAAWIAEKYRAWTDCNGDPRNALSIDEMLGNISLYWFTNCIGASFWPYYARMHGPWPIDGKIGVPTGYASFRARSCARRAPRPSASSPTSAAGA